MDDADRAGDRMQLDHDVALAHARHQIHTQAAALPAVGACYHCGASVADGHRWCDADCRDDGEAENKRRGRA